MKRPTLAVALLSCLGLFAALPVQGQTNAASRPDDETARYAGELLAGNYKADAPGAAVLVARGDTVLFRGARGEADLEKHVPLQPDSVFRIGSVSKQFAAAGLLKLAEAGKVKIDDPLAKYLPDYPGGDRITLLQLLNHTSGVKSYTSLPGYMRERVREDLTTAQMIDVFKNEDPEFAPGSDWAYCNSGYVLVGAVIEAASGQPWYAWLEQSLFKPLGMLHTGYGHDPRFAAQQVHGYSYQGGEVVPMRTLSMTQPHAAGALLSNVDDLFKWNRALHEGRVLASGTYAQMTKPVGKAADPRIGYGFGIFNDKVRKREVLQHGGNIFGFTSALSYVQGPDVTVVVLENDDVRNAPDSADAVARKLTAAALGEPYPAMKAVAIDAAALQAAEGVYRFDAETTRTLRVADGRLTAQRGEARRAVLTPIGADAFLYEDGFNRLELQRDAAGKISGVRFFPNGDGEGELGARTNASKP
jgi:D-alanyl-D-alanine carboxypeptidase